MFRLAAVKLATLFVSWQTALSGDIALFTPKEVLALIASLVDLTPPVPTATICYLLNLCCRAMVMQG